MYHETRGFILYSYVLIVKYSSQYIVELFSK